MRNLHLAIIVILLLVACNGNEELPGGEPKVDEGSSLDQANVTRAVEAAESEDPLEEPAHVGQEPAVENAELTEPPNAEVIQDAVGESGGGDGPSLVSNPGLPGRIIFESFEMGGQVPGYLYIMKADGSQIAKLIETPAHFEDINWNPVTQQLGVIMWEIGWSGEERFILDIASGSAHKIPTGAVTITDFEFLPNSAEIVFSGYEKSSAWFLYRGDPQSGAVNELERGATGRLNLAVSPSGRYVAYDCSPLCILDLEEAEEVRILGQAQDGSWMLTDRSDNKTNANHPTWAPEGNLLAFVHDDRDGVGQEICTFDLDSEESRCWPVSPHIINVKDGRITWSPDSNYIAYNAKDDIKSRGLDATQLSNLFALDVNSGEIISLTNSLLPRSDEFPLWIADDPSFDIPIASGSPFSAALAREEEPDSNAVDVSSLDQLEAADALQALIQAFADGDRASFDHLIEGMAFSPNEVWERMGEGCQDIDARKLTYLDTEDTCCTENIVEFMVLNGERPSGSFTLHRQSSGAWKIVQGGTDCGG